MIKSIEQQAAEYTKKHKITDTEDGLEKTLAERAYIDAAKSRDEQWQAVVNELREALEAISKTKISGADIYSGADSMVFDAKEAINKADQMIKEMGIG